MFTKIPNKISRLYLIAVIISIPVFISSCCTDTGKCEDQSSEYTGKPIIEFFKTSHDFGDLKEGEKVECTFRYKNTGNAPLKILNVEADCGCTVPKYSTEEILPGNKGVIKVVFNSSGFRNNIYKTIDVETNTDKKYFELVLTAFIENNRSLN